MAPGALCYQQVKLQNHGDVAEESVISYSCVCHLQVHDYRNVCCNSVKATGTQWLPSARQAMLWSGALVQGRVRRQTQFSGVPRANYGWTANAWGNSNILLECYIPLPSKTLNTLIRARR
jgi:hypothetical protein